MYFLFRAYLHHLVKATYAVAFTDSYHDVLLTLFTHVLAVQRSWKYTLFLVAACYVTWVLLKQQKGALQEISAATDALKSCKMEDPAVRMQSNK